MTNQTTTTTACKYNCTCKIFANIPERNWRSQRNAVGFAAACARLALPFYEGDHQSDLVAAIEVAENHARGEEIGGIAAAHVAVRPAAIARAAVRAADYATCATVRAASVATANAATAAADAAWAAAYAYYTGRDCYPTPDYATTAVRAGVNEREIQAVYVAWISRDEARG